MNLSNVLFNTYINEIKRKGNFFSWTYNGIGDQRNCITVDRVLGNSMWRQIYDHIEVDYLNSSLSDHAPLL